MAGSDGEAAESRLDTGHRTGISWTCARRRRTGTVMIKRRHVDCPARGHGAPVLFLHVDSDTYRAPSGNEGD